MSNLMSVSTALAPLVLAQVPAATESQIVTVLLGGAALLVVANQAMLLIKSTRAKPEPAEVQQQARADVAGLGHRVTRVEADHQSLAERVEQHAEVLDAIHCRERECEGKLHKRLDDVSEKLNTLGGKYAEGMQGVRESLSEIRAIVLSRKHGGA
jgi:hypothetical protein